MNQMLEISPSLFFQYAQSPHWIWYDIHGDQSKKVALPELTKRLIEGGVLHEEECVKDIEKVTIDKNLSNDEAEKLTFEYMKAGEELIYQGAISYTDGDVKFKGRPDFLKKCNGSSNFGDYHYIPIEIKNSTKCDKSEYKKQLMLYAIILNKLQGIMPSFGYFINKHKKQITCELTDKILQGTKDTIHDILSILRGLEPPLKITRESLGTPWSEVLLEEAKQKSDISLLYNIKPSVMMGLKSEGIQTLSDMASCNIDLLPKIKGASIDTLRRLQKQAKSLVNDEIILISKPDVPEAQTKIYFDVEYDPLLGVDYLFGLLIAKPGSEPIFKYFIAEAPDKENEMWIEFIDWIKNTNLDDVKVYHYSDAEKIRLKKLSEKYGGCDELELFISNLVDLRKVTTDSFVFPVYFYSIKDIAKYLDFKWQHEKAGGAQSIFWYEEWLDTKDRKILQDIINYNEDDVNATQFLHRRLIALVPT
jgi:predicted RecB family nuclease